MSASYVVLLLVVVCELFCIDEAALSSMAPAPKHDALPTLGEHLVLAAKDAIHSAEQAVEDSVQATIHNVAPFLEDSFVKHRITKPLDEEALNMLLLQGTDDTPESTTESKARAPKKKHQIDTNYTVVINTYDRHDCLRTVVDRWFECSPGEIRVVWSEGPLEIPEWLHDLEASEKLVIDRYQTNSLTNRFQPKDFKYDAVFSVEDDITYSCSAVQGMLKVFRQDPARIVSFSPRFITKARGYDFLRKKANTVFITKGGFSHKDLFSDLWLPEYDEMRDIIDRDMQGEDLLMSFVHAMHYGNKAVGLLKGHKSSITQYDCPGELDSHSSDHEKHPASKKDLHGAETRGVTKAQRWWTKRQSFIKELFAKYGDVFKGHDTKPMPEGQARDL